MNILVIGNGFDLEHGLLTKYVDFLEFVKVARQIIIDQKSLSDVEWGNLDFRARGWIEARDMHRLIPGNMGVFLQEKTYQKLLEGNIWIDYFLQCDMHQKENWIDFESEISRIIKLFDKDMKRTELDENDIVKEISEPFFAEKFLNDYNTLGQAGMDKKDGDITYRRLINTLEEDLNNLIRALEIYIVEYVNCINIEERRIEKMKKLSDYVLSFNYSDTYERLYGNEKNIDYIHGKAGKNNSVKTNNMVLGIGEYPKGDGINQESAFITFKKYYQRIHKESECRYKDWIYEIKESAQSMQKLREEYPVQIPFDKFADKEKHNLYIFGHSLAKTDEDILRELILNDNVRTTIFYVDKDDHGKKIANLEKVIGPDELKRRTGGGTKTIFFEPKENVSGEPRS